MDPPEKKTKKKKDKIDFVVNMGNVPTARNDFSNVVSYEPNALERSVYSQYDRVMAEREKESRALQVGKLQKEKNDALKDIKKLEREMRNLTRDKDLREIEGRIEKLQAKIAKIDKELEAGKELQKLKMESEKNDDDALVSAGLITPFESSNNSVQLDKNNDGGLRILMRKGTFQDDADDEAFAKRIADWKSGSDVIGEQDEEQILDEMVREAEFELEFSDEQEEGEMEEEENFDDVDLDFDFDADLNVVACSECLNVRGVSQVLSVLNRKFDDCDFDLPGLLKDCRFNAQRALNLIFTEEEGVKKKYPKPSKCNHKFAAPKQPKKKVVF